MFWMYALPLWLLGILCVASSTALSVAGVLVARRYRLVMGPEESAAAFAIHAFIGVVYAVSLGLIVVGVQGDYDRVSAAVVREASAASDLFRTIEGVDEPDRSRLQGIVSRYVDRVVGDEWPALQRGESSEPTARTVDSVARGVFTYAPQSAHAQALYPQLVTDADELLDARRERVFLGGKGVGPVIWLVVLLGAFITVGFSWFFCVPSRRAHLAMAGVMASLVGLMMFLIVALDHPAWGGLSVDAGPFVTVQGNLARWRRESSAAAAMQRAGGDLVRGRS